MLIFLTFVSEPCYDLLDFGLGFSEYLSSQSNMITLLLGYLGMMATEWFLPSAASGEAAAKRKNVAVLVCIYGLLGFSNYMLKGNFNLVGPLLVIAFYWYIRESKKASNAGRSWRWTRRVLVLLAVFICYLSLYFWARSGFGDPARWWEEVVAFAPWVAGHFLAGFILSFYNDELGYHAKWFRKLYVSFYPAHMFAVGLLCVLTDR